MPSVIHLSLTERNKKNTQVSFGGWLSVYFSNFVFEPKISKTIPENPGALYTLGASRKNLESTRS